ncbi:MAG: hypothetical protein KUG75_13700 [Pseudomonadales bacterium]|nr:hypothetical protein [Pseudomonadales bacterium]
MPVSNRNEYAWPLFGGDRIVPKSVESEIEQEKTLGFEEGRVSGLAQGEVERAELKQQMLLAVKTLQAYTRSIPEQQYAALVSCLHTLCKRVVGVELRTNPEIFLTVLRHCTEHIDKYNQAIEVCVHPNDEQWLSQEIDNGMRIKVDENAVEGCISIQTPSQTLEYNPLLQLDEQFKALDISEQLSSFSSGNESNA